MPRQRVFPKHVLLPQEHGAWMMFLAPLLIGLVVGGRWSGDVLALVVGALAVFLARQPLTVLVKIRVGRRSPRDLPVALWGLMLYAGVALAVLAWLLLRGYVFLLYLALPGALVLAWYLSLVAARRERHQRALDLVAAGIMALAAPAAVWVARGRYHGHAWWLWLLLWLQSAVAIVYVFDRLEQRDWPALSKGPQGASLRRKTPRMPSFAERMRRGWRSLGYTAFALTVVLAASAAGYISPRLLLPYALQGGEVLWGILVSPAVGWRPTRIGLRQLVVYGLFTLLFLWAWE